MKVAVIILHFGELSVTRKCIQTLEKYETYKHNIIVVNNMPMKYASTDFSSKNIIVINNKKNVGFATGVNVGIRYAKKIHYDTFFLLNNDTIISKPFLAQLVNDIKNDSVGIVAPVIRFKKNDHNLYDLGGKINRFFMRTTHDEVDKITKNEIREPAYVSGCCMLIRKEVIKKIGLFDEHFFLYYEDADFCLRAKKAGFRVVVNTSVVVDHLLSKSAGKMSKTAIQYLLQSSIIFGRKYAKNPLQKIANKIFILYQAASFLKANHDAGLVIAKVLLAIYVS